MMPQIASSTASLVAFAVHDQGDRPVCAAIAATTLHEVARGKDALSLEALWQHALARGAAGEDGTTLLAMADALGDTGQPSESLWPFDRLNLTAQTSPALAGRPPWYKADLTTHNLSALEIADRIQEGIPVLAAMYIYESFFDAGDTGSVEEPLAGEVDQGRHAVVCVACTYGGPNGDILYLLLRNSWGSEWGLSGHAWISAATFDLVCNETATLEVP